MNIKLQVVKPPAGYAVVHVDIVDLLQAARAQAARSVNALMTASYWEIGRRIVEAEQKGKRRAGYGEQLIERLTADLTAQFGRGFSRQNLRQMCSFYLNWLPEQILQTVSGESAIHQTASDKSQTPSAVSAPLQAVPARLAGGGIPNRAAQRSGDRQGVGPRHAFAGRNQQAGAREESRQKTGKVSTQAMSAESPRGKFQLNQRVDIKHVRHSR